MGYYPDNCSVASFLKYPAWRIPLLYIFYHISDKQTLRFFLKDLKIFETFPDYLIFIVFLFPIYYLTKYIRSSLNVYWYSTRSQEGNPTTISKKETSLTPVSQKWQFINDLAQSTGALPPPQSAPLGRYRKVVHWVGPAAPFPDSTQ